MNHLNKISCQGTTVMKFFGGFFSVTPAAPLTEIRSQQRRSLSPEAFNYHITKKSEHTPLVRNVNKSWHHAGYTGRGAVKKWALLEFGQIPSVHTAKNIRRVKICDTVSGSEILFSLTEVKKKEEKKVIRGAWDKSTCLHLLKRRYFLETSGGICLHRALF